MGDRPQVTPLRRIEPIDLRVWFCSVSFALRTQLVSSSSSHSSVSAGDGWGFP